MTFHYRDRDNDLLVASPGLDRDGQPALLIATTPAGVDIPLDRIEELVAGLRDTARQAAGGAPPPAATLRCNWARLGHPHTPHNWEPQPGMEPVHCPGGVA